MEEADIRSAEVKKSSYEFERDIVKGAVNQVQDCSAVTISIFSERLDACE